jgi:glucose/arabinose dehydrogenase
VNVGRRSVVIAVLFALVAALITAVPAPERAEAAGIPAGFTSTPVFTGLDLPTAIAFSPDGKVYVAEKSGVIKVFPNASSNNGVVFKDLSARVFNFWDRGLLGLTVDPRMGNGTGHDFIYALYAKDAVPGGSVPRWNDDCPTPPGGLTDGCVVVGTLSRIPVNANGTAGAEQVMIDNEWCQQFTTHSAGHLAFGPDGNLYVSGGDGGSYENADWGQFGGSLSGSPTPKNPCGDPPGGVGVANTSPTGRGGAMRSQSPRRPAGEPRLLSGTVLRINPDTAAGVSGNPMFNAASPSSNASRILAYGLRNPFRFTMRPNTNEIWVADVGWGIYEEINRITTTTPAKAPNFGWPCIEKQTRLSGYRDLDMCKALYNDTASPASDPYFSYEHGEAVSGADTCGTGEDGSSITGDAFYTGTRYPAAYKNALFFADNARNCIYVMTAGANGLPDPSTARTFLDNSENPSPVDLEVDPTSKDIFFVNLAGGTVNRISYQSSNQPPVAAASANPTSGAAPLSVQLNASGSSDPDGDALTYSWDIDGNGSYGDATGRAPTVSYPNGGAYQARVLVTDTGGLSATSLPVTITVTSVSGPTNTAAPTVSGSAVVGETLTASNGSWSGTAPITYARQWQRCTVGSTCADISGATGASYSPQVADQAKTIRVRITASNSGGSSAALSAAVGPVVAGENSLPVPVIDTPSASLTWKAGDTVSFSGHATDEQDGNVPASRLSWSIILGHCTSIGCHTHPLATRNAVASGTIAAPDHEAPSYIQMTLTATDAGGATASTVRRIDPRTVRLTFATDPTGQSLSAGASQSAPAPFTQEWVVNSQVQLSAPVQQNVGGVLRSFFKWSDGGAATHTVRAPSSNATYTATYVVGGVIGSEGGPPKGSLDVLQVGPRNVRVAGWTIDPDSAAPAAVHIYVNGTPTVVTANKPRADLGAAYPLSGPNHGYDAVVAAGPGPHRVCVYGINLVGPPGNATLGCRTITVGGSPVGHLDTLRVGPQQIEVAGWVFDRDLAGPSPVHVYVDSVGTVITANRTRSDIGAAYPLYGAAHGFSQIVSAPPGAHRVCVYGINAVAPGANAVLGCTTVVIGGSPFGSLDSVRTGSGTLRVAGWAIDRDLATPDAVHIYVDGKLKTVATANLTRGDVGQRFPLYGASHGFDVTVPAAAGRHRVCAYGINLAGPGGNATLGCVTTNGIVTVAFRSAVGDAGVSGSNGSELFPNVPAVVSKAPAPTEPNAITVSAVAPQPGASPAATIETAAVVDDHSLGYCSLTRV